VVADEPTVATFFADDETGVAIVEVAYTVDGSPAAPIAAADDGNSADGDAGDGVWGATLPGLPDGTAVTFEGIVTDSEGVSVATEPYSFVSRGLNAMKSLPASGRTVFGSPALIALDNGDVLMAYHDWGIPNPDSRTRAALEVASVRVVRSTDGGTTLGTPQRLAEGTPSPVIDWGIGWRLQFARTASGRILLVRDDWSPELLAPGFAADAIHYSDDDGQTWAEAPFPLLGPNFVARVYGPINGEMWHPSVQPDPGPNPEADPEITVIKSTDGVNWSAKQRMWLNTDPRSTWVFGVAGIVQLPSGDIVAALLERIDGNSEQTVSFIRSSDGGASWSVQEHIDQDFVVDAHFYWYSGATMELAPDGTLWLVISMRRVDDPNGINTYDIYYLTSSDGGHTWSAPEKFTEYEGYDANPALTFVGGAPLLAFESGRHVVQNPLPSWYHGDNGTHGLHISGISYGYPGASLDWGPDLAPWVFRGGGTRLGFSPDSRGLGIVFGARDEVGLASVQMVVAINGVPQIPITLSDDGPPDDGTAGDERYTAFIEPPEMGSEIVVRAVATDLDGNTAASLPGTIIPPVIHSAGNIAMTLEYQGGIGPWMDTGFNTFPGGPPGLLWPASESPLVNPQVDPYYEAGMYDYVYGGGFIVGVDDLPDQPGPHLTGWTEWSTNDWQRSSLLGIGSEISAQDLTLTYEDGGVRPPTFDGENPGTVPMGIVVEQTSYQWSEPDRDDFIIIEYAIENTGLVADNISGMRAALWLDPDIPVWTYVFGDVGAWTGFGSDDQVAYDSQSRILYAFDSGQGCSTSWPPFFPCPEGYVGLVWLTSNVDGPAPAAGFFTGDPHNARFWDRMNAGVDPVLTSGVPLAPDDYRMIISSAPFDIGSGDTHTETFGIVMGAGLQELVANAETMRQVCRLRDVCKSDPVSNEYADDSVPTEFALRQNYPNPFNPSTVIAFDLPTAADVSLTIYDILGREVARLASGQRHAGRYQETWDAGDFASGVYFYRLEAGDFKELKMLTLVR
jgi:hypothetical protein